MMMENVEQPFIEKYRPLYLTDVVGNKGNIAQLQTIAREGNLPNIIICVNTIYIYIYIYRVHQV